MIKDVGVTTGPINETIYEAGSPAALWFASTMFSEITRKMCSALTTHFEGVIDMLSPHYSRESVYDGIGKYNDRIIFTLNGNIENDEDVIGQLQEIVKSVKSDIKEIFPEGICKNDEVCDFLNKYIQIRFIVLNHDEDIEISKRIGEMNSKLDALELIQTFPKDTANNVLKKMFLNIDGKDNRNQYIHESKLFTEIPNDKKYNFINDRHFRTIEEIAGYKNEESDKIKSYFAVVHVDGDHIGRKIEKVYNTDGFKELQKLLFNHADYAAKKVNEYGGMTIYAGGDDLLFLAPIVNANNDNVFQLCNELRQEFSVSTLSFGISIQYYKFPLYEALKNSRELLNLCKKDENTRNSMALMIQKHSGKAYKMMIPNTKMDIFLNILSSGLDMKSEGLGGLINALVYHRKLIDVLDQKVLSIGIEDTDYKKIWANFYDHPEQEKNSEYFQSLAEKYYANFLVKDERKIKLIYDDEKNDVADERLNIDALISILKIKSFFMEETK